VRRGAAMSIFVNLMSGVKQVGVLSPALFSVFVDDLVSKLEKCGLGCYFKGLCVNSLMYADDLILLSISVTHMQQMIELCNNTLTELDLQLNIGKSGWLRIGDRHNICDISLRINNISLAQSSEIRYLGCF